MDFEENTLTPALYNALRKSVGWAAFCTGQAQKALNSSCLNVTAYLDAEPVAMARVVGDGIYFLLVDVVVAPAQQGKGIGKSILTYILQAVKNSLSTGERCSVQLISAQGKEDFYSKIGFSAIPSDKSGHGMQLFLEA